jgi:head-tail adaptor
VRPALPRFDHPLVLEAPERAEDGGGGHSTIWRRVALHWAEIRPVTARETVEGAALASGVSHRIRVRAVPRNSFLWPGPAQRLRLDDRLFDILGVAEEGDAMLRIWAREGGTP